MVAMLKQIAQHMERLGPQRDHPPGPGQRIELGIEETIGEDIAHRTILRAVPVLLAAPYAVSGGVGSTDVRSIPEKGGLVHGREIAGTLQLPARQRSGRLGRSLISLAPFAEGSRNHA